MTGVEPVDLLAVEDAARGKVLLQEAENARLLVDQQGYRCDREVPVLRCSGAVVGRSRTAQRRQKQCCHKQSKYSGRQGVSSRQSHAVTSHRVLHWHDRERRVVNAPRKAVVLSLLHSQF